MKFHQFMLQCNLDEKIKIVILFHFQFHFEDNRSIISSFFLFDLMMTSRHFFWWCTGVCKYMIKSFKVHTNLIFLSDFSSSFCFWKKNNLNMILKNSKIHFSWWWTVLHIFHSTIYDFIMAVVRLENTHFKYCFYDYDSDSDHKWN